MDINKVIFNSYSSKYDIEIASRIILNHKLNYTNESERLHVPPHNSGIHIVVTNQDFYEIEKIYIAKMDYTPIGCSIYHRYPVFSQYRRQVYVVPKYRNLGIGKKLIHMITSVCPDISDPISMGVEFKYEH